MWRKRVYVAAGYFRELRVIEYRQTQCQYYIRTELRSDEIGG